MPDFLMPLASFLVGACVGSFLNVAIYRVPLGLSVNDPKRSFCPVCKKPIPWYLNIPLLSWLLLRGKCAECGCRIPIRYWLVELLTAAAFTLVWLLWPGLAAPLLMGWAALAIVISFIDIEHLAVYPAQTWSGAALALAAVALEPSLIGAEDSLDALKAGVIGLTAGYLLIRLVIELGKLVFGRKEYKFAQPAAWSLRDAQTEQEEVMLILDGEEIPWSFLFSRPSDKVILEQATLSVDNGPPSSGVVTITPLHLECDGVSHDLEKVTSVSGTTAKAVIPREAMGLGDANVMAMVCALTGWRSIPIVILSACLLGILSALPQRLGWGARLPFGPLLLAGGVFWLLYGQVAWEHYLSLFP